MTGNPSSRKSRIWPWGLTITLAFLFVIYIYPNPDAANGHIEPVQFALFILACLTFLASVSTRVVTLFKSTVTRILEFFDIFSK